MREDSQKKQPCQVLAPVSRQDVMILIEEIINYLFVALFFLKRLWPGEYEKKRLGKKPRELQRHFEVVCEKDINEMAADELIQKDCQLYDPIKIEILLKKILTDMIGIFDTLGPVEDDSPLLDIDTLCTDVVFIITIRFGEEPLEDEEAEYRPRKHLENLAWMQREQDKRKSVID